MKKILAAALAVATAASCAPVAYAAKAADPVETLAAAMEKFETEVTVKTDDAEGTLQQVFTQNPKLFYYFNTYSAEMSKNGKKSTYTFSYHDTDVSQDDILVVDSSDTLNNVIGYALTETMSSAQVVFTDSTLNKDSIIASIENWEETNYLAYMGYQAVEATQYASGEAAFSTWTAYDLSFLYVDDAATIQNWRQQTEEKVLELCGTLFALDMPEWERELEIHDYIVENCVYDQAAESSGNYTSANTAYGCLIEGKAVCEGYAQAANLLFKAAGLSSYYVKGAGDSADHAWNCVQIDGSYYWVDVTWDDPVAEDGTESGLSHTYFNLTDSELNTDHAWQTSQYPSCTSTTWAYSKVKEALAEITDESGKVTTVYENYSTENVTTLEKLSSDLAYALGVDTTAGTGTGETGTDAASPATTAATETVATDNSAATTDQAKTGHPVRTFLIVVLVLLILLVAAYMVYRRIMYLRMLERKRKRAAARKRAAQNGCAPRGSGSYSDRGSRPGSSSTGSGRSGSSGRPRRDNPFR